MKKRLSLALLLLLALTLQAQTAWHREVTQRLDRLMHDELLQTAQLGLMVWDLTDDTLFYQHHPRFLMRTASTMKALTAITALDCLGPSYLYRTALYHTGTVSNGTLRGDLVCVGGMDPLLSSSDLQAMARSVRQLGITRVQGNIVCDGSMKDTLLWGEGWCWDDDNPVLTPLLVDGKPRFAQRFAEALAEAGVRTGAITQGSLPSDATLITAVSRPLGEVLMPMMKESDNLFAETVYYQIAASTGKCPATAEDAQGVETELLRRLGLNPDDYRLADGSGLSLYNYLSPECETLLMRYAWQRPHILGQLLSVLPIAGIDGTLKNRMRGTFAEGNVRAKTGTVTGVSTLTGYLTASNGHHLCFSIMVQGIRRSSQGRALQDRICTALVTPLDVEIELIWSEME